MDRNQQDQQGGQNGQYGYQNRQRFQPNGQRAGFKFPPRRPQPLLVGHSIPMRSQMKIQENH